MVIAGQSDVYLADINYFRGAFGLTQLSGCTVTSGVIQAGSCTAGNFQQVWPEDNDPGLIPGNLSESDLDIETLSGVAPGAKIVFVTSGNGVDDSVSYAVDQDPPLGTVISYSYGACEALVSGYYGDMTTPEAVYEKAVSEGISMFAASGDSAAAICDDEIGTGKEPALYGQSVSYPASSAYVTGVGGTEFDEGSGSYWSSANGSNGGSALSYIPESGWNDTAQYADGNTFVLDGTGGGPSNCAHISTRTTVGGYAFGICDALDGGFTKPTWQSGVTPGDGVRDVPDIAFSASNFNDPYIVCTPLSELGDGNESTSSCSPGGTTGINNALTLSPYPSAFGGTSAPTPVTAGMAALLNQYLSANGLGLINPQLYALFSANPSAVFNEINAGTNSVTGGASSNVVTCTAGTPTFETSTTVVCPSTGPSTGEIGFTVGGGHAYSEVTGVGSVDINAFALAWAASRATTATTISPSATNVNTGVSVTFTATVTPATATGTVGFVDNTSTILGTGTLSNGIATLTTTTLPGGSNSVAANYSGDGYDTNSSSAVPAVVTVEGFTLSPASSSTTVAQGASQQITINSTAVGGFSGTISFACTGLPAEASCQFNPTTVTGTGSTMLTVTTAGLGQAQRKGASQKRTLGWLGGGWLSGALLPVFGICLVGFSLQEGRRGRWRGIFAALTVLMLVGTLLSCGGSGGSTTTNNPVPSISSLSPTQQAAGSQSQTLTINGANFITGSTLTYNGVAHAANYVSATQLTTTLSASDLATQNSYPVVVTNPAPGGGSSSPTDFNVVSGTPTGSFTVTVTGTSGSISGAATFTLTVQ